MYLVLGMRLKQDGISVAGQYLDRKDKLEKGEKRSGEML